MTRRVFITGISGFIGQALTRRFLDDGMQVTGLTRSISQVGNLPEIRNMHIQEVERVEELVEGEILHPASYAKDLAQAQIVIHLAGPTLASDINANPIEMMKHSWLGSSSVLDGFCSGEGEHFVFISTGKVYGPTKQLPITEEHPLCPATVLGKSKKAIEDLISFYAEHCDSSKKKFTILRLFNAYGPGQKAGFLIPTILNQLSDDAITLGDTRGRRDFIYISDVVEAINTILLNANTDLVSMDYKSPDHKPPDHKPKIFNVGSGQSHSPEDIIKYLEKITDIKIAIQIDQKRFRPGEPDEEYADVSKLASLGWKPGVTLFEGLERTWRSIGHV